MTLSVGEFIRRFLMYVLPKRAVEDAGGRHSASVH
jgi:hypothetical protein